MPLRLASHHPASDAFFAASLSATPWISRLPEIEGDKPGKKKLKAYPIGFFHIDIAEVRTDEGKLYLFVAIDRTSKIAFAKLEREANRLTATAFLESADRGDPLYNRHHLD